MRYLLALQRLSASRNALVSYRIQSNSSHGTILYDMFTLSRELPECILRLVCSHVAAMSEGCRPRGLIYIYILSCQDFSPIKPRHYCTTCSLSPVNCQSVAYTYGVFAGCSTGMVDFSPIKPRHYCTTCSLSPRELQECILRAPCFCLVLIKQRSFEPLVCFDLFP